MTATDVQNEIITPMQRLFLPPRAMPEPDVQAAMREYVDALKGFNAPVLKDAWCRVRDGYDKRVWPSVGHFAGAARAASRDHTSAQKRTKPDEDRLAWERWLNVRRSEMGREACRLNVAWALKCAILHDKMTVEAVNLKALVRAKEFAQHTADKIEAREEHLWKERRLTLDDANAAVAMQMWRNLQQKEIETQNEIRRP